MTTNKKLYELLKSANLIELEKALIENLREEAAKESGNKKELTIIKNMMKHNEKNNPIFCGYCEEVGGYSFTDGYRIFKDSKNNYNYSQSKTSFKASDLIKNTCENCTNTIEIDIAALKLYISTHSKKELKEKPFVIKLTNNAGYDVYMGFNALYLKDAIDFLGTNMFYYPNLNNNASLKSCIYSFAGHKEKEAILLPVNIRDTSVVEANQVYEVQVLSVKKAI